ncbi:hypothetical protein QCK34_004470 [Enterobacter asburiae]|nr:hypothetical protein [Enterobacter asburiae]
MRNTAIRRTALPLLQAQVTVTAGAPSQVTSAMESDRARYASGEDVVLALMLKDAAGNTVTEADLSSAVVTAPGLVEKDTAWTAGPDGTFTRTWTAGAPATGLKAGIQLSGWTTAVETAAYEITVGAPYADASTLSLDDSVYVVGEDIPLTLTLKDKGGNLVKGADLSGASANVPGNTTGQKGSWNEVSEGVYVGIWAADSEASAASVVVTLPGSGHITATGTLAVKALMSANLSPITGSVSGGDAVPLTVVVTAPDPTGLAGYLDRALVMKSTFDSRIARALIPKKRFTETSPGVYEAEYEARISGDWEISLEATSIIIGNIYLIHSAINYEGTINNIGEVIGVLTKNRLAVSDKIILDRAVFVDDEGSSFSRGGALIVTGAPGLNPDYAYIYPGRSQYEFTAISPVTDARIEMCGVMGLAPGQCLYSDTYTVTP